MKKQITIVFGLLFAFGGGVSLAQSIYTGGAGTSIYNWECQTPQQYRDYVDPQREGETSADYFARINQDIPSYPIEISANHGRDKVIKFCRGRRHFSYYERLPQRIFFRDTMNSWRRYDPRYMEIMKRNTPIKNVESIKNYVRQRLADPREPMRN